MVQVRSVGFLIRKVIRDENESIRGPYRSSVWSGEVSLHGGRRRSELFWARGEVFIVELKVHRTGVDDRRVVTAESSVEAERFTPLTIGNVRNIGRRAYN